MTSSVSSEEQQLFSKDKLVSQALSPPGDDKLNYFKFAFIVLNEFPKALRQTFRSMWDNTFGHLPGLQTWDDSIAVRNLFLGKEGDWTKVPTNLSYEEWDCTALFQATIYARSFALPDSTGHRKTLSDLYVKPHKLAHGSFHPTVVSPGGNEAETFALAIDQLRLLRNLLCHATSFKIDKAKFDQYAEHAKDAFNALGVNKDVIDDISSMDESHFPTEEVEKLKQATKEETRAYIKFLEGVITDHNRTLENMSSEIHELKVLLAGLTEQVKISASKDDTHELKTLITEMMAKMERNAMTLEQTINNNVIKSAQDTPGKYSFVI